MNWLELLQQIFELCLVPLMGVLTVYLVKFINIRADALIADSDNAMVDKYVKMLADTISTCVIATNQTYVDVLKGQNAFDANAQKQAFQMTFDAVNSILTEEAKVYLTEAFGDLNAYMTQQIEATVKNNRVGA